MTFDEAVRHVLSHEGGYVDHPSDPGGETMYGITVAVARAHGYTGSMRDLSLDTAKQIYRRLYWDSVRANEMPAAIRYPLFDAAVNSGPRQSIRWLQRALGVPADGVIGPVTLRAAHATDARDLAVSMIAQRLRMLSGLQHWPSFSRGWARRIADVLEVIA